MAPQTIDLTTLLAPYPGEWVALSQDETRVVGHGATIEAALKQAVQNGVEHPVILKAPDQYTSFLL